MPPSLAANTANNNPTAANVKIISHRRNNSLLVIARPADITYIKGLVEKLDRESTGTNFLQRKLRDMPGGEFLQVARDALSRDNDIDSEGKCKGASGSNAATSCRRTSTNSPSTGARQASRHSNTGGDFGTGLGIGGDTSDANRSALNDPEENGAPESAVGLITEREQRTENGVIFLRRIPVLKHLFNRKQVSRSREELLIFIQPKIIKSSDPLDLLNDIEAGRSRVFGESMRFANEIPEAKRALPVD
ncbi:MAG: hypothetical protein ACOYMN_22810 [Roseimicrobium sp.]